MVSERNPVHVRDIDQPLPAPEPVDRSSLDLAEPSTEPGAPAPTQDEADPWLQQPGESDRDHDRFRLFREMGATGPDGLPRRRDLKELARALKLSPSTLHHLSSRWNWVARAHAWDRRPKSQATFADDVRENAHRLMRVTAAVISDVENELAAGRNPLKDESSGKVDLKGLSNMLAQVNQTMQRVEEASPSTAAHDDLSVTDRALMDALRGKPLARLALRAALSSIPEPGVGAAMHPHHTRELEHYEMLAELFPYGEAHLDAQKKLLQAAEYMRAAKQNQAASRTLAKNGAL